MNNYPDYPIFTKTKDQNNRDFYISYSNKESTAVISLKENGKNILIKGNPKISIRLGNSNFGEEIIFELLRTTTEIEYTKKRTSHDTIEIYLPKDMGLKFLRDTLNHLEKSNEVQQ